MCKFTTVYKPLRCTRRYSTPSLLQPWPKPVTCLLYGPRELLCDCTGLCGANLVLYRALQCSCVAVHGYVVLMCDCTWPRVLMFDCTGPCDACLMLCKALTVPERCCLLLTVKKMNI
jgi:hypothetical protein